MCPIVFILIVIKIHSFMWLQQNFHKKKKITRQPRFSKSKLWKVWHSSFLMTHLKQKRKRFTSYGGIPLKLSTARAISWLYRVFIQAIHNTHVPKVGILVSQLVWVDLRLMPIRKKDIEWSLKKSNKSVQQLSTNIIVLKITVQRTQLVPSILRLVVQNPKHSIKPQRKKLKLLRCGCTGKSLKPLETP